MADTTVSLDLDSLAPVEREAEAPLTADEQALVEALRRGREEAYEELIQRYQHSVYNLVCRLVGPTDDPADVVQEVFLKIFRKIGSFRGESSLKTWIYRIAVNEAHNQQRWFSRHRKREVEMDGAGDEESGGRKYSDTLRDPGRSPYELVLHGETMVLIEQALARIKPVFRDAVVLRDIEGLTYEEIAEVLQVSLGTVKSRILRGREALRKELEGRLAKERPLMWSPRTAEEDGR